MITVLVAPDEIAGESLELTGETYRHLFRARRLTVGERLRAVDGQGRARWAKVVAVGRRSGRLELGEPAPAHEHPLSLELLVATPRRERASWLVEKATELGVSAVRFVHTERSPRQLGEGTLERLRRVAAAALEQCHRSRLPELSGVHPWEELPELVAPHPDGGRLFLDPGAEPPGTVEPPSAALLIGPEGGWSDAERARIAELGGRPAGLGERVLRVETAALAGAALLLCR